MKKKGLAIILIAALLVAMLAACSGGGGGSSEPATGEKRTDVNIYSEGVFTSLNPYGVGCTAYVNMYLLYQLYDTLVQVNDAGDILPSLATAWEPNADGTEYTFTLREGVKFHNGEEMKASDVAYSINRAMTEAPLEPYYRYIDSVEAAGDYTVKFKLKAAYIPFVSDLINFPIVSEAFASSSDLLTEECGTGAYMLQSIDMNTGATLVAFDDYWRGEPSIKTANWKVITEGTTASVAFERGELDVFFCYNVSAFAPLEATGKYNTQLATQKHTAVILLNNKVAPLDNKLVRQALSYATDRDTMITIAYEGLASPTYLMANPSSWGVPEDLWYNHYEYNLDKAKEVLAEAGYPDGLDLGDMTVISGSYHEKYAQVWQNSLSQIGVKINLVGSESAVADTTSHNYVTATMGESFTSDFAFTSQFYTGNNKTQYDNARVAELYDQAAVETDATARAAMYREAIEIIFDECTCIPIFNKQVPWVWDKNLNAEFHMDGGRPYYVYDMSWN